MSAGIRDAHGTHNIAPSIQGLTTLSGFYNNTEQSQKFGTDVSVNYQIIVANGVKSVKDRKTNIHGVLQTANTPYSRGN
jgi:hypothetical protein